MKILSTTKAGLGGLALAASMALFSSGASAIPVCTPNNLGATIECGGDLGDFPGSAGWDFDFDLDTFFTAPVGELTLLFDILSPGVEFDAHNAYLTDIDGNEITTGLSSIGESFTFDSQQDFLKLVASWTLTSAIDIYDFHVSCSNFDTDACSSAFAVSYNFVMVPDDEGSNGNTVPAPSAAPLLLLGLAVTGLGAFVRRRRSALEIATA